MQLVTETKRGKDQNTKVVNVVGVVTKKVVFENRPAPDMLRANITKR